MELVNTFQGFKIGLKVLRKFFKIPDWLISSSLELYQVFSIYWSHFLKLDFVEFLLPESRLIITNKATRREKGRSRSSSIRRSNEEILLTHSQPHSWQDSGDGVSMDERGKRRWIWSLNWFISGFSSKKRFCWRALRFCSYLKHTHSIPGPISVE